MDFYPSTAEQIIGSVRAAHLAADAVSPKSVARLLDTTEPSALNALRCATSLGLLAQVEEGFHATSWLCRYTDTTVVLAQAAVLRIALDSYGPFRMFTERLRLHGETKQAAQEVVAILELNAHWEEVRATLLDLGAYTQVLTTSGQGEVELSQAGAEDLLAPLTDLVHRLASANDEVRLATGAIEAKISLSEADVVIPLVTGAERSLGNQPEDAVHHAGNAVESFLVEYAARHQITANQPGIISKADFIRGRDASLMPKKLLSGAHFLGSARNAADHGTDEEIGAAWAISPEFGAAYVGCALSFLAALLRIESSGLHEL